MHSRTFAYSPRVERDRHYFGFLQSQSKQDKAAHRLIRRLNRRHLYSGATFNGKRQYVAVDYRAHRSGETPTELSKSIEVLLDGSYRRVGA